jgi:hypothetical protein
MSEPVIEPVAEPVVIEPAAPVAPLIELVIVPEAVELELESEPVELASEPATPPGHLATAMARTFSASSLGQACLVQSRIPNL